MTTQIKRRRGTTTEHSTFTGAEGELTIDTTKDTVVVHDGSTAGGHPLAKESSLAGKVDTSGDTMTGPLDVQSTITTDGLTVDGNVGIGTSSPTDKLNISSGSNQIGLDTGNQATYGTLDLGHFTNGAFIGTQAGTNAASNLLRFGTSGTERMRIASSGNVGIGTSSPDALLHTSVSFGTSAIFGATNTGYGSSNEVIIVGGSDTNSGLQLKQNGVTNSAGALSYIYNQNNAAMLFGTNNTERMRIDSSGNVGIGTDSPSYSIHTKSSSGGVGLIESTSSNSDLYFKDSGTTYNYSNGIGSVGNALRFRSGDGSEAMRIDSSGNVLVGKTSASSSTQGVLLEGGTGQVVATATSNFPLYANRLTTDGELVRFQKDGTTVGSIGVQSSADLTIGSGTSGFSFSSAGNAIVPNNPATNTYRDAAINLGYYSGGRFKDLYLSGGVYLGGTGAANKLDDYEEGTWSPHLYDNGSLVSSQTNQGTYVKVGDLVHITVRIFGGSSFTSSVYPYVNLPFLPASGNTTMAMSSLVYSSGFGGAQSVYILDGSALIRFSTATSNALPSAITSGAAFTSSSKRGYFSLTYKI